jgi:hypothetical protein
VSTKYYVNTTWKRRTTIWTILSKITMDLVGEINSEWPLVYPANNCLLASFFSVFFSPWWQTLLKNVRALYEFVLLLVEFQLVYKQLGPDSSSVMTGFVLVSFSGRVLVVQEVLRTVIIAPWFICVNKILRKYDLKEAYNYLDNPIKNHDGSRWWNQQWMTTGVPS